MLWFETVHGSRVGRGLPSWKDVALAEAILEDVEKKQESLAKGGEQVRSAGY